MKRLILRRGKKYKKKMKISKNSKIKNYKYFLNKKNTYFITKSLFKLKKIINVIHKYHIIDKRILFINTPKTIVKLFNKLMLGSTHFFMPESFWVRGLLTNTSGCYYSLLKNKKVDKKTKYLTKFFKKYDLIVLFKDDKEDALNTALKESFIKNIPIVSFNFSKEKLKLNGIFYEVLGDFEYVNAKKLIFTALAAIITRLPDYSKRTYISLSKFRQKILKKKNGKREKRCRRFKKEIIKKSTVPYL